MSKPRKYEIIRCVNFCWRLANRQGVWQADGRSNPVSAGRHSLGTRVKQEALDRLSELDQLRAEELGLIPPTMLHAAEAQPLLLEDGRALYETHISRPPIAGGVKPSTRKRYRTVLDKFLAFASSQGVASWQGVTAELLTQYASHLENNGYARKSQLNELTTLKQAVRWLIDAGHLKGVEPLKLRLRPAESQRAYCYRRQEVAAMIEHCRKNGRLNWLTNVIIALACTGLRISELIGVRWTDVDLSRGILSLTDETGHRPNGVTRQTKSGRSRHFPIHEELLAVLRRIAKQGSYVFLGPRNGKLKADSVRRAFKREVIEPLQSRFPSIDGGQGFGDGRLHSFRHFFCSRCANSGVPERMVMDWLGHKDSEMARHYYHLHDEEAQQRMQSLDFFGNACGRSAAETGDVHQEEAEPKDCEQ